MSRPVETTIEGKLTEMARKVDNLGKHTHPSSVRQPATITGPRSDVEAVLGQLLDALAADELIIDETT